MDVHLKAHLFDLLTAIEEIESFFNIHPKIFEQYQTNILLKRAVERNITIIGEAMSRILKLDDKIELSNSRKIVDLRNRVMHGYDTITDEVILGNSNQTYSDSES